MRILVFAPFLLAGLSSTHAQGGVKLLTQAQFETKLRELRTQIGGLRQVSPSFFVESRARLNRWRRVTNMDTIAGLQKEGRQVKALRAEEEEISEAQLLVLPSQTLTRELTDTLFRLGRNGVETADHRRALEAVKDAAVTLEALQKISPKAFRRGDTWDMEAELKHGVRVTKSLLAHRRDPRALRATATLRRAVSELNKKYRDNREMRASMGWLLELSAAFEMAAQIELAQLAAHPDWKKIAAGPAPGLWILGMRGTQLGEIRKILDQLKTDREKDPDPPVKGDSATKKDQKQERGD